MRFKYALVIPSEVTSMLRLLMDRLLMDRLLAYLVLLLCELAVIAALS